MATRFSFNGHTYQLVQTALSWTDASAQAQSLGGHLAIITTTAENALIFNNATLSLAAAPTASDGGGARYLWLGASDRAVEGTWTWVNGSSMSGYTNWGSGAMGAEPDDYQGAQDALGLGLNAWPAPSGGIGVAGEWNDINESNLLYFVVEWDYLHGTSGNDSITGTASGDRLDGLGGHDTLNGGGGADTMTGGTGNDTYIVAQPGDKTIELVGQGVDTTRAYISWTLKANVENLILLGTSPNNGIGNALGNTITGNANDNYLYGEAGDDTLNGGAGSDFLNGGAGLDSFSGGVGSDIYVADSMAELTRITEAANQGEIDTVNLGFTVTSVTTITLSGALEHIERVNAFYGVGRFNLTGNARNNVLDGNSSVNTLSGLDGDDALLGYEGDDILLGGVGADLLYGGDGNDRLNGGSGSDTMFGGLGNDVCIVDNVGDEIIELPGQGVDTVQSSRTWTLGAYVEHLTLTGSLAINGAGNGLNNSLVGNSAANAMNGLAGNDTLLGASGNDSLNGGAGNDNLAGGLGNDSLTGGTGYDRFVFDSTFGAANIDRITDFVHGVDKIVLEDDVFTALSVGTLGAAQFRKGAGVITAGDADDRLILNTTTGALYYDANGSAAGAAVQIAVVQGAGMTAMTAGDFLVVA